MAGGECPEQRRLSFRQIPASTGMTRIPSKHDGRHFGELRHLFLTAELTAVAEALLYLLGTPSEINSKCPPPTGSIVHVYTDSKCRVVAAAQWL